MLFYLRKLDLIIITRLQGDRWLHNGYKKVKEYQQNIAMIVLNQSQRGWLVCCVCVLTLYRTSYRHSISAGMKPTFIIKQELL